MIDNLGLVRRYLADLDAMARDLEVRIVEGQVADWAGYRAAVERRQGLLSARRLMVEALSEEQRRFLGLGSTERGRAVPS